MINVSSKFKRLLYSGESNLIVDATITLANNTVLNVSNPQIMSGGLEIDDAVGSDGDFDCIGSTIVNGCDLILYNNNEIYSDYDFINAKVNIAVKLQTDTTIINGVETPVYESVQKGVYTVDEATFSSMSVTLKLLDNMCQFDRPYDSYGIYRSNTTIYDIVIDACEKCGVLPASTLVDDMPSDDFIVAGKPKDNTTYREVIGWCAAIAGSFARCNPDGELEFVWFDTAEFASDESIDGGIFDDGTPYYTSGDNVNGGVFNPWNDPSNIDDGEFTNISQVHYISSLTAQNIGIDDVVITDIQIAYEVETDNKVETKYYPTTITNDSYVISIGPIPFINANNVQSFYNTLRFRLFRLSFRICNVTHAIHDPTIEAGDIAWLWDAKGVRHRILITRVTFSISGAQTIVCGAKTPARNSATQLTALAKANARSNRRLNEEKSIRQQLEENFNSFVANASGLYFSKITSGGSTIIYGHDKPQRVESKMVLKISNGAISMTDDYKGTDEATSWYGFQFDGTWLANIISTVNLFFDHAHGGTLKLGGSGNGNGDLKLYNSSGKQIGSFDNTGLNLYNKLYSEGVPGQYEVRLQSGTLAFYYENVYVGEFVSTYIVGNVDKRGISMHLSEDGDFMSWSVYNTFTQNYDIKLSYLKDANSTGLENNRGLANTFRVNCDFDMAGNRIVDPRWKFRSYDSDTDTYSYANYSGVSGTYYIGGSDGYKDVLMIFKRGILVHSEDLN